MPRSCTAKGDGKFGMFYSVLDIYYSSVWRLYKESVQDGAKGIMKISCSGIML